MPGIIGYNANGESTRVAAINFHGRLSEMEIPMKEEDFLAAFYKLDKGMLIQDAFPNLNPEQREFILSGTTPEEWDKMFKE